MALKWSIPTTRPTTTRNDPRSRTSKVSRPHLAAPRLGLLCAAAALLLAANCTTPSSRDVESPTQVAEPPLFRGALSDYLSPAGLSWAVELHPAALLARKDWRQGLSPLLPDERLAAFSEATGISPESVRELWLVGYDGGQLTLVDAGEDASRLVEHFRGRAQSERVLPTHNSALTHVTALVADNPAALVALDTGLVATAELDLSLARWVRAVAEGRLAPERSALSSGPLSALGHHDEDALVRAFAVGPFPDANDALVALTTAVALSLRLDGNELTLDAVVQGAWEEPNVEQALEQRIAGFLASREASALGLSAPLTAPTIHCQKPVDTALPSQCQVVGTWSLDKLVAGLWRVTSAELPELME